MVQLSPYLPANKFDVIEVFYLTLLASDKKKLNNIEIIEQYCNYFINPFLEVTSSIINNKSIKKLIY